jgi:hypothetical protein
VKQTHSDAAVFQSAIIGRLELASKPGRVQKYAVKTVKQHPLRYSGFSIDFNWATSANE